MYSRIGLRFHFARLYISSLFHVRNSSPLFNCFSFSKLSVNQIKQIALDCVQRSGVSGREGFNAHLFQLGIIFLYKFYKIYLLSIYPSIYLHIWKVKVLVSPILSETIDYNPPVSSVYGLLQARILEWVAIPFSRGSSWPRDRTWVSCTAGRLFTIWTTREVYHLSTYKSFIEI